MLIYDDASERNRRLAWAKYMHARRELEDVSMLAAELAEWIDTLGPKTVPDELEQLLAMVRSKVGDGERSTIKRYVRTCLATVAA